MKSILILLLFFVQTSFSQLNNSKEIGIMAGISNYYGDLNDHFGYKGIDKSFGVFYKQNFDERFALKIAGAYSKIGYKDSYSERLFNKNRNLSFSSNIIDLTATAELNFFSFFHNAFFNNNQNVFSPYLSFGTNVFFFNPQANLNGKVYDLQPLGTEGQTNQSFTNQSKYKLYNFSLVYGLGAKYYLNKTTIVGVDFLIKRTFSDYLDDVSSLYPKVIDLPDYDNGIAYNLYNRSPEIGDLSNKTNTQRGNSRNNDDYVNLMINLSFVIFDGKCKN